jgi:hypothetical protein
MSDQTSIVEGGTMLKPPFATVLGWRLKPARVWDWPPEDVLRKSPEPVTAGPQVT